MLSGIKTGKKKKRKTTDETRGHDAGSDQHISTAAKKQRPPHEQSENLSAAQKLKQELASGIVPTFGDTLEARLSQATTVANEKQDKNVVYLTGAAAASTSDRPDYRPGTQMILFFSFIFLLKSLTHSFQLDIYIYSHDRGLSSRRTKG